MKAITFQVFDHFANSATVSLTLAWSQASKYAKKIETVAWNPYLNKWTLCFYKEKSVFRHGSQVVCEIFFCLNSAFLRFDKIIPRHKNYISGYIWHRSFIQTVKCSFLENLFIKVFMMRRSRLVIFYFKEKFCFARVNKSLARCLFVESVRSALLKKFYLWLFLTQIVHSKR